MKNHKKVLLAILLLIPSAVLLILELFPIDCFEDAVMDQMIQIILTRSMGSLVFIPLCIYMGYNVFGLTKKWAVKKLVFLYVPKGIGKNGRNGQISTREANEPRKG